ncbi:murein transglycosylase A [Sphingomonas yabuuchiae]|uniref:murein transglycosylase A n=1 Tax=Sphingomonas yabuuchiae TaxID=172044 RepID=UPI000AD17716|nr:murein transglycosylase A [Sphingomonas yabuuchiae]
MIALRGYRVATMVALSVSLSACAGRIVPPGASASYPSRGEAQPQPRPQPRPRPGGSSVQPSGPSVSRVPDGPVRIVGATPLPATPVVAIPGAATAAQAGVLAGPPVASLPITEPQAEAARAAFLLSCPGLMRRTDASGLTQGADWQAACQAAASVPRGQARNFFARYFEAVQVGDGRSLATGYYEPEIAGSRDRRSGYEVPIYARPRDLIDVDLGAFSTDLKGKKVRGKVQGTNLVPYDDRTAIEQGSLEGRAPILAWGADPVEVFFLQIQGSGRLRLPDGGIMRIGYDTQNGRDYTGIGALMKARGLLGPGQTSMQGIVAWLHDHPEEGRAIMRENKSFVFFRELNGAPQGAMGYAVIGQVSVAADPKFVPLGAPVFLSMDRQDATGLWVAQDTGGAIKGSNRFDTFWGAGDTARAVAGGMSARGTAFLMLPIGTLARAGITAPVGTVGAIPQP